MGNDLTRRAALVGAVAVAAAGAAAYQLRPEFEGAEMSPPDVHKAAISGEVLLIDIRRPDEWAKTGIGQGAHPLDMRRDDFVTALTRIADGDTTRPIALICARGVRSDRTSLKLENAGFTRIIDIPEGMLGSKAGPGWLERGLPVTKE